MTGERREIKTGYGVFVLRAETADDEPFLFRLFAANHGAPLRQAGLAPAQVDQLVALQHRSQTFSYRSLFPAAVFSIIERDGEPIGRLIESDEPDMVYFVDVALVPEQQARGLGTALTHALMQALAARGRGARVKVLLNNTPSLKLFRALGFAPSGPPDAGYVELRWRPVPPVRDGTKPQ